MKKIPIRSLSLPETNKALKRLSKTYSDRIDINSSGEVFSDCIKNLGGLFGSVTSDTAPKNWWFFRIRTLNSFDNESKTLDPKQYSYPPPGDKVGRCHFPKQSVFYASDSIDGCIAEMKTPNETDYLLSVWKLPIQAVRTMKFLCGSNIIETSRLYPHKAKIFEDACKSSNMHDELNSSRLKSFMTAWSDIFLHENHYLSACIAYECMYGKRNQAQDLIAFGSAVDGSYINYVLTPEFADKLILESILHFKIGNEGEQIIERTTFPPFKEWNKAKPKDLDELGNKIPFTRWTKPKTK